MDLINLKNELEKFFDTFRLHAKVEISNVLDTDLKVCRGSVVVTLKELDNEELNIVAICYENGTSQVLFNLGPSEISDNFYKEAYEFSDTVFGLKCVYEYGEIRFYNQFFSNSITDFIFNFDHQLGFFSQSKTLNEVKKFLKYVK